ncbi:MAG: deoxyribonuclease IV [Propionibacteriaceae bacterium]|jgi:deoxyribonuclease-4|nr:deoxyribonuclease IV [Propionibacteriaceae bacterium]
MIFGAHADLATAIADTQAIGGTICQVFLGDPQSWKGPTADTAALRTAAEAAGIGIYVHAPYLINVATTNNRVRIPSRQLLGKTLKAAAEVGALGVIAHGGHVLADDDPEAGFANWRKCVDQLDIAVPLLIENTAGGANAMARHLERITRLWAAVSESPNAGQIGWCLDTCHAHAAGLDLRTLVADITAITGRIDLVHLNDSRDAFGSGADRHANLGQGNCDPAGLAAVATQANAPVILETPGGVAEHRSDLEWLLRTDFI